VTSRRHLLILSSLLGLRPAARAAEPADLVFVQAGTLPIILTAPHGGRVAVPGVVPRTIPPRRPDDTTYVTTVDPETDRLALGIAARIKALTQRDVYLVMARFERKYIDANRQPRIAFDQPAAEPYYDLYHRSIRRFVDERSAELHEVERAMRGFVGEFDHVGQAFARVRHLMSSERVETRLGTEARQRRLRLRRNPLELRQQSTVDFRAQRVERVTERRRIAAIHGAEQRHDLRAITFGVWKRR
jgi:hypothetical protein